MVCWTCTRANDSLRGGSRLNLARREGTMRRSRRRRSLGKVAELLGQRRLMVVAALLAALLTPRVSEARVVRFVVEQVRSFAGGTTFGDVGPYVRLDGSAYLEVDPRDPLNAVIVNLDKAPRNARGMVEFSAPVFILKPADM